LKKNKLKIIAEAGVNHNGIMKNALKLVDIAKKSGADFVKFQYFRPNLLSTRSAKQANYQKITYQQKNSSQFKMLEKLRLSINQLKTISKYCKKKKIKFLLSIFDHESIKDLKNFKMEYLKIPSGEITNFPLLKKVSKLNHKIILSTGMCNLKEIKSALKILKKKKIVLFHCNTDYPTALNDVNLNAMVKMHKTFKCEIGYSDHTDGFETGISAVALGAKFIEKHFTLNKNLKGPDHKASLSPKELNNFVKYLRNTNILLGNSFKKITLSEKKNINIIRKSLYAKKTILKGEKFTEDNIVPKRPAGGINPMLWDKVIGKKAKQKFSLDDKIKI